jgi:hypothetical protein
MREVSFWTQANKTGESRTIVLPYSRHRNKDVPFVSYALVPDEYAGKN